MMTLLSDKKLKKLAKRWKDKSIYTQKNTVIIDDVFSEVGFYRGVSEDDDDYYYVYYDLHAKGKKSYASCVGKIWFFKPRFYQRKLLSYYNYSIWVSLYNFWLRAHIDDTEKGNVLKEDDYTYLIQQTVRYGKMILNKNTAHFVPEWIETCEKRYAEIVKELQETKIWA